MGKSRCWQRAIACALFFFFTLFSIFESPPSGFASALSSHSSFLIPHSFSLIIPNPYGTVEEFYDASRVTPRASAEKIVIYIQDAHDSLDAQEHIAKIISHLVERGIVRTVFEEGYEGKVPTDEYFGFIKNPVVKEKVSYFLMDKLRIGGAEYAHINRKKDFELIGADNLKLYEENVTWYRKAARSKKEVSRDLDRLVKEIRRLGDRYFPNEFKTWLKLKDRLDQNELSLADYLRRTVSLAPPRRRSYPLIDLVSSAEQAKGKQFLEQLKSIDVRALFAEIERFENDLAEAFLTSTRDRAIFRYRRGVSLLRRLNEIELTPDEFNALRETLRVDTESLARFIVKQTGKSIALSKRWEEAVTPAIRFYEMAKQRDHSIETHLDRFLARGGEPAAVLVFGGFHKANIIEMLRRKNLSYVIVSPKISSIDKRHQDYYKRLMSVGHHPFETSLALQTAAPAERIFSIVSAAEFRKSYVDHLPNDVLGNFTQRNVLNEDVSESRRAELRTDEEAIVDSEIRALLSGRAPPQLAVDYRPGYLLIKDAKDRGDSREGKIRQARDHLSLAAKNPERIRTVERLLFILEHHPQSGGLTLLQFEGIAHRLVKKYSGNDSAYLSYKQELNRFFQEIYPAVRERVFREKNFRDRLSASMIYSAVGNLVDPSHPQALEKIEKKFGFSLEDDPLRFVNAAFNEINREQWIIGKDDFARFLKLVKKHRKKGFLYFTDNHGEFTLDQITFEVLLEAGYSVAVIGKSENVRDDVTKDEALAILQDNPFLNGYVESGRLRVLTDGSYLLGADLSRSGKEAAFIREWLDSAAVIAKGAGSSHTLLGQKLSKPLFLIRAMKRSSNAYRQWTRLRGESVGYRSDLDVGFAFQPEAPEFQQIRRAELRRNNGPPWSEQLLEGVGRFRIDERAHRTPDWHRMNVAGHKLLDRLLERPGPVKADEIVEQVNKKLKAQVLDYGEVNDEVLLQNVTALLDRLVDLELVKKTPQGYDLAVERPIFAIKVNHIRYILRRLAKLLKALEDNERDAEEALRKFFEDYSGAVQHWTQYEMEARDPVLKAVALLDPSRQDKLREFLDLPQNVHLLGHLKLVDAIWLMLRKTGREDWLSIHANALIGRNIYYIASEIWLAVGGLGRVGQFLMRALQVLADKSAQVVTIEPYYRDVDYSQLPVPVEGLGKKPEPIFEFDLTLWRERSRQWKKVTAQVFKGRNRFGVEVYLIKDKPELGDGEEYYTKHVYRYGPEHGAASWSEFTEFMSKASLKLIKRLEKQKFDEMKQQNKTYKPPVVWGNDGQLGFLPLFKRISDSLEEFSREEWVKRFREDGINFSELKDFEDFFTDPDLELSLRDALAWFTTHTFLNRSFDIDSRFVEVRKMLHRREEYLKRYEIYDATSAGIRSADGVNGVSAMHVQSISHLDPETTIVAIRNGDDLEASSEALRSIFENSGFQHKFPRADPKNPNPEQLDLAKKLAKEALGKNEKLTGLDPEFANIDPDTPFFVYTGRCVEEKAGLKRAFVPSNIKYLVNSGATVVMLVNVQAFQKSKDLYEELKKTQVEVNRKTRKGKGGRLIVATGWGIPEQRAVLAAADVQVNDSDPLTEASGFTETNDAVNGAIEVTLPAPEGTYQQQGEIIDWDILGEGNTMIAPEESIEGYKRVYEKLLEEYNKDRLKFRSYQVTSVRLSQILDALLTGASYFYAFHEAFLRKEDPIGELTRFASGDKAAGKFFKSEWLRLDLIRALENRSREKPDPSTFELKTVRGKGVIEAFLSKGISGAWDHNLVLVERGARYPETGQEASGTVRIDEETVPEFFKWLDSQDENSKISVVDASSGKVFGARSQKEILEQGIYVSIPTDTRVQVLKLVPTDGEAQSSKDEPVTRASFFYDPGLTESLKTEILNLVPSQLLKWKGKSSDDVVWWVSGEGFYPLERVPGNWQEAGHYLVSSKGRGRFALTLSTTLNEFLEDKFDGRYRYGKGDPYAQFLLENAPHNVLRLNVGEGQIGYFPEAGVPIYNKRYQDPSFAFWFTYHLVPFARRLGYGKIEIEKRWQARRFLEELDFKLKLEGTDSNPPVPVWEFDVASAAARSEARSEQPAEGRRREAEINSKFKTSAIRLGGSATQSGGQNSKLKSRSETRAEGLEFLTRPRVAVKNGKADLSISFRLDDPGRLRKWRFFVHYGLDQDRAVHWLDLEIPEREIAAKGAGIFEIQVALPLLPERLYRVTVFAEHQETAAKVWQGAPAQDDAIVFISLEDGRFKKANEEARKRIRESLGDFDRFVDAIYELSEIEKIRGIGKLLLEAAGEDQALVHFLNDSHARLETDLKKEEGERTERLKPAYRALRTLGIGEVVIVAAEGPHAVGGGLAKVIEGLPRALADQGVSVTVITLLYDQPRGNMHPSAEDLIRDGFKIEGENMFIAPQPAGEVSISLGPTYQSGTQVTGFQDNQLKSVGRIYRPSVDEAWDGSVRHLFLSDKDLADQLYGARSSRKAMEQAIFLSRGALEILREPAFGIQPHIVISNDWPAGLVPVFLKLDPKYQSEKFADAQAIHMIHNLGRAYQGRFFTNEEGVDLWPLLKLPHSEENYRLIADPNDSWLMNLQAAAIRSADALLTVSRDYAGQMLTKAGGEGLEDLFREKEDSFFGISNGIPAGYYRRTFWRLGEQARKESGLPLLVPDFSDESYLEHLFSYKQSVKERVQADYGLAERPDAVLLSMVGRMAEQKGIGLLTEIDSRSGETYLERILKSDERIQFLIGGPPAEGDEAMSRLRAVVKSLMKKYPGRIRGIPERDGEIFTDLIPHPETLRIIFASRFFLMPSRYEPGGITQLEALAGGTVPIARNVGGIKSTLEDYSTPGTARRGKAFLFEEFNGYSLFRAAGRALAVTETSDYAILINRAARSGNDWSDRMPKYLALFGRLAGALRFEGEGKKSEGIRFEFLSPLAREIDRMRPRKDDQASEKQDQTGALLKQAIDRPGQNREIDGRSEVRFERLIEGVKTPAVALVDFTDFSEAQVTEFFARAFLNPDRLKLVIYNVKDSNDKRLEPFRRLWKNVRILEGPLEKAWEAQGRLAGNNGQAAIIHFSKGNFSAPFPSRSNRAQPVFSFRYLAAQKQSGLLGAALLYVDFVTTGDSERLKKGFEWLGIEKRPGNFFVVSSEYLDRLEREFDQAFVIQIAA